MVLARFAHPGVVGFSRAGWLFFSRSSAKSAAERLQQNRNVLIPEEELVTDVVVVPKACITLSFGLFVSRLDVAVEELVMSEFCLMPICRRGGLSQDGVCLDASYGWRHVDGEGKFGGSALCEWKLRCPKVHSL